LQFASPLGYGVVIKEKKLNKKILIVVLGAKIHISVQPILGEKHIKVVKFQWIKIQFESFFLMWLKICLKYEFNILCHFQFEVMML
jgi:hypothetical protein